MIKSFKDKETEKIFHGRFSRKLPQDMPKRDFPPTHPGEMLLEEFLKPLKISQDRLAKAIGVPPRRIHEVVRGKRSMSADMALRLGRFFAMEAQFWLHLQTRYDLEIAREDLADTLERDVRPYAA